MTGPGRPLTLTPDLRDRIAALVENAGVTYATAAVAQGVPKSTAMLWQDKGRAAQERRDLAAQERRDRGFPTIAVDRPYLQLVDQIDRGKAQAIQRLTGLLIQHASDPRNWQAAVKLLSALDPDTWRETRRTEVTGAQGGPIQQETTVLTAKGVQDRLAALMPVPLGVPASVLIEDDGDEDDSDRQV